MIACDSPSMSYVMKPDSDIQKLMLAESKKRQQTAELLTDELSQLTDKAACSSDGAPVFRNADMQIFTADGSPVPSEELSSITWKPDAPSYEEYTSLKMRVDMLEQRITTLKSYKNDVLGYIRMRMSDHEHPPSMEEMQVFQPILKGSL